MEKMITELQLQQIEPLIRKSDIDLFLPWLKKSMQEFEIHGVLRESMFIAHLIHETENLSRLRENMNYSAKGLLSVFPKYFTKAEAAVYARKPEMIANRVYASRYGNGPEGSGDGWKYRGGGGFHATFKDMYQSLSEQFGVNFVKCPEKIAEPEWAMRSAGYIWKIKKMNTFADASDIKRSTKALNGGFNGLSKREGLYQKALSILK